MLPTAAQQPGYRRKSRQGSQRQAGKKGSMCWLCGNVRPYNNPPDWERIPVRYDEQHYRSPRRPGVILVAREENWHGPEDEELEAWPDEWSPVWEIVPDTEQRQPASGWQRAEDMYWRARAGEGPLADGVLVRKRHVSAEYGDSVIVSPRPCEDCGDTRHRMAVTADVGTRPFYICEPCAHARGLHFFLLG